MITDDLNKAANVSMGCGCMVVLIPLLIVAVILIGVMVGALLGIVR